MSPNQSETRGQRLGQRVGYRGFAVGETGTSRLEMMWRDKRSWAGNSAWMCEDQCTARAVATQGCAAQLSGGNGRALSPGQDDTPSVLLQKEVPRCPLA